MSTEEKPAEPPTDASTEDGPVPPKPREMKCVVLAGFGSTKMLRTQQKNQVTAKEGEVLVRVKACGLNFVDLMVRQGVIDHPPKTPVIMGYECSGDVEAIGENTSGFAVGDRVIGFCDYGAWSEVVAIPSQYVYKMPDNMSYQDGAALPMSYLSAYIMLFDMGNLRSGQSVLAHSIGGGVGTAITQLLKLVEGATLFGTASYQKHESIKGNVSYLFDRVVDYSQEVRKVSPEGVDIVLDSLCGEDSNKGISLLKPMGKYILYGSSNVVTGDTKSFFSFAKSWWQVDKVSPIKLYDENKTISGFQLRHLLFKQGQHPYIREVMGKLFNLYTEGKIRPVIDSAWAFEDVGEAMQKLHDRKNIGKVLLDPSLEPKPKPVGQDKVAKCCNRQHTESTCSDGHAAEKDNAATVTNGEQ